MIDEKPTGAMTVAEFCSHYSVGRTFFYNEVRAGRLNAVKAGAKTLVLKAEAARWTQSLPKMATVMAVVAAPREQAI